MKTNDQYNNTIICCRICHCVIGAFYSNGSIQCWTYSTYLNSVDTSLLAGESFKDFLRNDYCLPYFLLFRCRIALFARNWHGFNLRWNYTAVWGICDVSKNGCHLDVILHLTENSYSEKTQVLFNSW